MEIYLLRRSFLAGLTVLPALPLVAHAAGTSLNIGIYPGTGKADILTGDFRAYAMPFADALGSAVNAQAKLTLFRSIRSVMNSLKSGRLDLYFVPPSWRLPCSTTITRLSLACAIRLRGCWFAARARPVTAVALTEKESWLDVMARHTLKKNKVNAVKIFNFKAQDDVALAIERDYAQAGSLRSSLANPLIEKGLVEIGIPCPPRRISP